MKATQAVSDSPTTPTKKCSVCGGKVRYPYGYHEEGVTCSRTCDETLEENRRMVVHQDEFLLD